MDLHTRRARRVLTIAAVATAGTLAASGIALAGDYDGGGGGGSDRHHRSGHHHQDGGHHPHHRPIPFHDDDDHDGGLLRELLGIL